MAKTVSFDAAHSHHRFSTALVCPAEAVSGARFVSGDTRLAELLFASLESVTSASVSVKLHSILPTTF
jgi:hypothetical protein